MEIKTAEYLISSPKVELCPKPDKPEFAFIGRSNVGKSSLINMLTGNAKLAKVSGTPGKTQMINHFLINKEWYLVDLPGYGYAKVSRHQRSSFQKMIKDYMQQRENLLNVLVLIDSRHRPQKADLDFLSQLGEWEVPFSLIFTKADKSTQRDAQANVRHFKEEMKKEWQFIPRTILSSAVKHLGKKEILLHLHELMNEEEMQL